MRLSTETKRIRNDFRRAVFSIAVYPWLRLFTCSTIEYVAPAAWYLVQITLPVNGMDSATARTTPRLRKYAAAICASAWVLFNLAGSV
jgi:hypothetical protein